MRDMMCILYTNRKKNGEYILELQRMVCLYHLQWLLTFSRGCVLDFGMRLFGVSTHGADCPENTD
jgi:hypothetical protein